ncbi:hypothetical protein TRFO_36265 [Tritrichomonas foetus]|uniref:Importin N-terminal domain-containing protein n=1 Tax=Tritrichomonas foetus TaxID=1144522 RepID=A0A1J4JGW6_9EUKA|nr:hypothetical protein TRFO_36265 [Tritrichomonas foetus]|eukprot:OHS97511.1 hypothetical protein TRFO_36265 [Tritrichomonas foetus]
MINELDFSTIVEAFEQIQNGSNKEKFLLAQKQIDIIKMNKNNIWVFLQNLCNQQLEPQFQLYILRILKEMTISFYQTIPLFEIKSTLYQISSETINDNISVLNVLSDFISLIEIIIFYKEDRFDTAFFDFPEISELQWSTLNCFMDYISSPPSFLSENFDKNIVHLFKSEYFIKFLQFSFNFALLKPENTESHLIFMLISKLMGFLVKNRKLIDIQFLEQVFQLLNEEKIYIKFQNIIETYTHQTSSHIIEILSFILQLISPQVCDFDIYLENIIDFLTGMLIFSKKSTFFTESNDNFTNLNSFCDMLLHFPVDDFVLLKCEKFTHHFIEFLDEILSNDYFLYYRVLFASRSFLFHINDYIPQQSALFHTYSRLTVTFIQSTLNEIEIKPIQVFENMFLGADEIKKAKKLILTLIQISEPNLELITKLIIDEISNILCSFDQENNINNIPNANQNLFSLVGNVKISFLIQFCQVLIKFEFLEDFQKVEKQIFDLIFSYLIKANDFLEKMKNKIGQNIPSEIAGINFLRFYIQKYIEDQNHMIQPISYFPDFQTSISFIFLRLWKILNLEICSHEIKKVMEICSKSPKFIESISTNSDLLDDILNDYLSYPCNSIIYRFITIIISSQNQTLPFLNKLFTDIGGRLDEISVKTFFKISSQFFITANSIGLWRHHYFAFSGLFQSPYFESISNDITIMKYLLKFIFNIAKSIPNHVFSSNEPHSMNLIRNCVQLLINATNTIKKCLSNDHLKDFESDESSSNEQYINDNKWNLITLVCKASAELIKSKLPNFGIMKEYNDFSICQLFYNIIEFYSIDTFNIIIHFPDLHLYTIDFIDVFVPYYLSEIKENLLLWNNLINVFHLFLESNQIQTLSKVSQLLCALLPQCVNEFKSLFVIELNNCKEMGEICFPLVEFILQFYFTDPQFVISVIQLIERNIIIENSSENTNDTENNTEIEIHSIFENLLKSFEESKDKYHSYFHNNIVELVHKRISMIPIKLEYLICLQKCFQYIC